jgi:hypothetical protein
MIWDLGFGIWDLGFGIWDFLLLRVVLLVGIRVSVTFISFSL